ncbi:hypothetical protein [Comamonas kerstersii]
MKNRFQTPVLPVVCAVFSATVGELKINKTMDDMLFRCIENNFSAV